jgi:hypothetical protein
MCKVAESERSWINAFKIEVFLLKFRSTIVARGTDVSSFGAEEEVKDKLATVDLYKKY